MVGERIRKLREDKKMSMSELAEKAGVAKSYLSSIERNVQSNPTIQFIEKVSKVIGVSVNDLISIDGSTNPAEIDNEWLKILHDAIELGVTKKQFREFLDFHKWRNSNES